MKNIFLTMSLGIGLLFPCKLHAQSQYPFQNTTLSTEERVDDLIKRMTLEEKIAMANQVRSRDRFPDTMISICTLAND